MTVKHLLREKRDDIQNIAAKHGVYNVRVFGSAARGEAGLESDIDLLVEAGPTTSSWFPAGLRAYPNNPLYCGRLQSPMPALSAKNVLSVEKTTPPSIFGLPPWPRTFRSAS